jgi:hypothetical protein
MSTSPDNSPHRPEQPASAARQGGLLPLPSKLGIFGAAARQTSALEDEVDQPHIEEQTEKPNPFAALARPPPETSKATLEAPKPAEKSQANPFGSIFNKIPETSSNPPKFNPYGFAGNGEPSGLASTEKPTSEPTTSSTNSTTLFSKPSHPSPPAETAPSPAPFPSIFSQPATQNTPPPSTVSSPASFTNVFSQPASQKTASTTQIPSPQIAAPSKEKQTVNVDAPANTGLNSEDLTGFKSKWITDEILKSLLEEDNLPAPPSDLELTEEETKYYYQKLKLARLNGSYREYFASPKAIGKDFQAMNLTPIMANYIHMYEELMREPIQGRLTDLIHAHGVVEGQRIFDQEHGRLPIDGTSKRRAGSDIARGSGANNESVKKSRTAATDAPSVPQFAPSPASSDTSNIFRSILDREAPTQSQANGLSSATNGASSTGFGTSSFSTTTKQADTPSGPNGTNSTNKAPSFGALAPSPATSGFKVPSFGAPAASPASSNGVKPPTFGAPVGNFLSQFGQSAAKTAAAEKKKRKEEDFDSDDSDADEAEWERKYEEEQVAKKQKLEEELKQAKTKTSKFVPGKGFVFEDTAPSPKSDTLAPPTVNGGFFGSRSVSPVPSNSGGSVFDAPRSDSPNVTNGNIFGYLSDVEGSGKGDADDEDSDGDDQGTVPTTKGRPEQSKVGQSSESDDPPSDTPSSRSLFDRINRDDRTENMPATRDGTQPSLFSRATGEGKPDRTPLSTTEGNQTSLFNFTKTSPGDHTWKPDSPIKFGTSTKSSSTPGGIFGNSTTNGSSTPSGGTFGASSSGNATTSLFNFNSPTSSKSTTNESSAPSGSLFGGGASGNATTSLFNFNSTTPSKSAGSEGVTTPAFKFAPPSTSTTPFGSPNAKSSGTPMFANASSTKPASSFLFPPSATPSALGSSLTSAATSRATTPGLSDMSGAESTAGEHDTEAGAGDAAPILEQNDLVGMRKDQEGHDVLAEAHKAKAYKMDVDPKNPEVGQSWQVQGVGPIAVLTNQESGVVKILMKRIPAGGVVLNTRLIPDLKYEQIGKRARFSVLGAKGLESWLVQFASEGEVKDFVSACEVNKGSNAAKD